MNKKIFSIYISIYIVSLFFSIFFKEIKWWTDLSFIIWILWYLFITPLLYIIINKKIKTNLILPTIIIHILLIIIAPKPFATAYFQNDILHLYAKYHKSDYFCWLMNGYTINYNYKYDITKCLSKVAIKKNNPNICLKYIEKNFKPEFCISETLKHIKLTKENQNFCFMLSKYSTSSYNTNLLININQCFWNLKYNKNLCNKINPYFYNNKLFCENFNNYMIKSNDINNKILKEINLWNNFFTDISYLYNLWNINLKIYYKYNWEYIPLRIKYNIKNINTINDLVYSYDYDEIENIKNWEVKIELHNTDLYLELIYNNYILKDIRY